jgi:hypothetical protein
MLTDEAADPGGRDLMIRGKPSGQLSLIEEGFYGY